METTLQLTKLDVGFKEKLAEAIAKASIKAIIEQTKAASDEDTGTFDVIISTMDVDRHGESVDVNGWDLTHYKTNGVVLWAHDYGGLPIGVCTAIATQDGKLRAQGKFVPGDANPFAQQVRKLYDFGAVKATSVGFIAEETNGNVITKAELLEFSFVPVPANPYCLTLEKAGWNVGELVTKGLLLAEKKDDAPPADAPPADDGAGDGDAPDDAAEEEKEKTEVTAALADMKTKVDAVIDDAAKAVLAALGAEAAADDDGAATEEGKAVTQKEGRVLSDKNRSLIQTTIEALANVTAALKALHDATEPKGGEGKAVPTDGGSPKQRSIPAASPTKAALEEWLFNREVLRIANNATSKALERINERIRGGKNLT